ncbi:MAG: hypothetical protein RLZZ303_637 [Candidatus Hydrogenedentota bacterium]
MFDPVAIVGIVAGAFVLTVGIIAASLVVLVNGRRRNLLSDDESRLMQELHQGMLKMERRVETLETLLLERETKGR